ncbi:Crp/Fnr family transcriptional regulator [Aurantibacter sp.]|uniref:Crp/Fnr family transcriptional regulator n=1 Tax=Aurantibacter sp. TaxID=2807103 RepID=UPI0035C82FDB
MAFQSLLNYINAVVSLTKDEEAVLLTYVTKRKYLKGQFILQQGDIAQHECFIVSGCTRMFHSDDSGQEHIILFAIENWWTSDIGSFISQTPADFNVQCIEDTELVQFPYQNIEALFKAIPKLERFFRKIIEKAFVATQKRIVRNFSLSAKERYVIFRNTYPELEQRIPQYMIASYLGITKEFFSKMKKQLLTE